jgi:hypothetical protein
MSLNDYVLYHTERGECQCGKCIDKGDKPDPIGHTVDIFFFKLIARNDPTAYEFLELIKTHKGIHCDCDPLDGQEHNYIELGGWIGDQGRALQFMGLGTLLGVFKLITPKTIKDLPDELMSQMAGMGFITVQHK